MKKMKRVLAFLVAAVMCMAMVMPAMAADPTYTITVTNDNSHVTISGKTYSAYKLFDMTYQGTTTTGVDTSPHAYTISTSNPFYTNASAKALLDNYFAFTATANDNTVMIVELLDTNGKKPGQTGYDKDHLKYTEEAARTLADALKPYLPSTNNGQATVASGSETCTINTNPNAAGYYLVYGTASPSDPNGNEELVAAIALTSTDPQGAIKPKVDAPPLNKTVFSVSDPGEEVVENNGVYASGQVAVAKVGSIVHYQLDSVVPDMRGYSSYTFYMEDTMSSGLTFDSSSLKVYISKTEGQTTTYITNNTPTTSTTKAQYTSVTLDTNVSPKTFKLTFNNFINLKDLTGYEIKVTYDATVNSTALSYDYENNSAQLTYSNNPYDATSKIPTPPKETYVIDLNLDVLKIKTGDANTKLDGAEFKLFKEVSSTDASGTTTTTRQFYKWDTTNNKVTWVAEANADVFVTDTNGNLTQQVRGLDEGTYYLLETKAPAGYNPLAQPVKVVITVTMNGTNTTATYSATYDGQAATMTNGVIDLTAAQNSNQPVATGTIENAAGTELPATGGIGTTLFYVFGAILVIGGGVVLVTRRRMNDQ